MHTTNLAQRLFIFTENRPRDVWPTKRITYTGAEVHVEICCVDCIDGYCWKLVANVAKEVAIRKIPARMWRPSFGNHGCLRLQVFVDSVKPWLRTCRKSSKSITAFCNRPNTILIEPAGTINTCLVCFTTDTAVACMIHCGSSQCKLAMVTFIRCLQAWWLISSDAIDGASLCGDVKGIIGEILARVSCVSALAPTFCGTKNEAPPIY